MCVMMVLLCERFDSNRRRQLPYDKHGKNVWQRMTRESVTRDVDSRNIYWKVIEFVVFV